EDLSHPREKGIRIGPATEMLAEERPRDVWPFERDRERVERVGLVVTEQFRCVGAAALVGGDRDDRCRIDEREELGVLVVEVPDPCGALLGLPPTKRGPVETR